MGHARKLINLDDVSSLSKFYNLNISFTHIPYMAGIYRRLGTFTSEDVGKWVIAVGTVVQATPTKGLQKSKLFSCNDCGARYRRETHYQTHHRFDWPPPCSNLVQKEKSNNLFTMFYKNLSKRKGKQQVRHNEQGEVSKKLSKCGSTKFTPVQEKKICVDYKQLRLQEQFKHISAGRLPQSIVVVVEGVSGANWRAGDDIIVSGILDYRFKKPANDQRMQIQLIIVANSIHLAKSSATRDQGDRQTTAEQTQESFSYPLQHMPSRERLSRDIELRNAAIAKFCPNIYGRENVKLGIMLSILGGVSIENEQTKIRGQSHVLLVGEPGTGKSVFLKEAANLAQRSFFTNGIGTSSAGLSVSYAKDGADWTIEPGALVLADNGVCCIDQLTLLSKKDENSLLQAMEQQTVSSAKASVVGRLNARTTLICACNPITPSQKYDPSLDLQVNTGLSIPLLTRFDLILILKDQGNPAQDIMKCEHVLNKFMLMEEQCHSQPSYQKYSLRHLIRKCRLYEPQLRGGPLLSKYYIEQRKNTEKVTTARAFESLCRLAEAHAKMMMRDYTTSLDCLTAIMLTEGAFVTSQEDYRVYAENFSQKYGISLEECLEND